MGRRSHESGVSYYLGRGNHQEGELHFKGQAHLEGEFVGRIHGEGTLLVGPGAEVQAEIESTQVVISGKVIGNVKAFERIELKKPGHLVGDLTAPLVVLEEGVRFEGRCHMALDENQEEASRLKLLAGPR